MNGTLYTGVTSDLMKRIYQHKTGEIKGFTYKYKIHRLVFFESTNDVKIAIQREKEIKSWTRKKKIALIESKNPNWLDLSEGWFSETTTRSL